MGWIALLAIGVVIAAILWRARVARPLWAFAGAALMLGAAGYAMQGRPTLAGSPVKADAEAIEVDPQMTALRESMVGRYTADVAYLTASDAMMRAGDSKSAVWVVLGGIRKFPDSMALWTGLGSALSIHDGNQLSPTALFAFRQAIRLAPANPAPQFFLGLAYVRAGRFADARPCWARALALTPPKVSYRAGIATRLALLDQFLVMAEQAQMPVRE